MDYTIEGKKRYKDMERADSWSAVEVIRDTNVTKTFFPIFDSPSLTETWQETRPRIISLSCRTCIRNGLTIFQFQKPQEGILFGLIWIESTPEPINFGHGRKWVFQMKAVAVSGTEKRTGHQSSRSLAEP